MRIAKHVIQSNAVAQSGFAIIELLVVSGILSVLVSISLRAINPGKQLAAAHNVQIQANESAILDAIYMYEASNEGNEPLSIAGLTATPKPMAMNLAGSINVCPDLIPNYLVALPIDSLTGSVVGSSSPCGPSTTAYDTGFTISQTSDDHITIAAAGFNGVGTISVTR
jgi:prepilin-type N-terminal cleavage/methylation domain-containing protein